MNWSLIGWSFATLRKHKQLVLFPILSAVAALSGSWLWFLVRPERVAGNLIYWWLAPLYFFVSFVIVFFNCALASCANASFSGAEPTLGYGCREAAKRFLPILEWALLSTTVGLILNALERRASWVGRIGIWLFGATWAMATYLVVPVLIAEDRSAVESVRRSALLAKETWGKQLIGQARFMWRGVLLFVPGVILGAVAANGYPSLWPLVLAWFVISVAVLSAAKGIFEVALYRYAALGEVPADWSQNMLPGIMASRDTTRSSPL